MTTTKHCPRFRLFPAFLPVVGLALCASGSVAQTVKLSGPLARPVGGDIRSFQVDQPGNRVVYLADQEQDDVFELFSVRPGNRPRRLNPPLPEGSDVENFQLSPDGTRVVYRTRLEAALELFTVSVKGGASVRLNGPLVEGGGVASTFLIDPTSRYVVFFADAIEDGRYDLFSAPVDGSSPAVRLSRTELYPSPFQLGGGRVFYRDALGSQRSFAILSVPLDGSGEPVQLTPLLSSDTFQVTADGSRALSLNGELCAVPPGGGAPVQLSVPPRLGDSAVATFELTPDGRRAVYSRAGLFSVSVVGDEAPIPLGANSKNFQIDADGTRVVFQQRADGLFSVPILGGTAPVLIAAGRFDRFQTAAKGRVVFAEDVSVYGSFELDVHSARVDGSEPPVLLAPVVGGGFPADYSIVGENVIYRSLTNPTTTELFTVPADGSRAPRRIDRELVAERGVQRGFAPSGDGKRVVYLADRDIDEAFELFIAPSDGSRPAMKLNPPLPLGQVEGDVGPARFSADGTRAVFLADAFEDEVVELFSVSSAGDEPPVRLNEPLVPGGDVKQFELVSEDVVYLADQEVNDVTHLYVVPIGGGTPVRLDGSAASVFNFQLTSDGSRIVYRTDEDGDRLHELRVVSVAGDSPPALLVRDASSRLPSQVISPTSDRLVYLGDPDRDGQEDLFSVPLAGGSSVRLDDPAPSGTVFLAFPITADGQRVLYLRLRVVGTSYERALFSVPIDGSSSPIRLDTAVGADSSVTNFALSPDGKRVVFASDGVVEGLYELFSMPVDASTGPVRLHTGNVGWSQVTPDGKRVVYLAPTTPSSYELRVVPLDGSSPPIALSASGRYEFPPNGLFLIMPDSARLVFRAALGQEGYQLHLVPLDGSSPPIRLTRPLREPGIVQGDFRLTPDGRTVVYRFGDAWDLYGELFQVPIDGPRLPLRISQVPALNGFDLSPDGEHVLHRTAQEEAGVIELYSSRLKEIPPVVRR